MVTDESEESSSEEYDSGLRDYYNQSRTAARDTATSPAEGQPTTMASEYDNWQQLTSQHRITPLAYFPRAYTACKQVILQHQQLLMEHPGLKEDLLDAIADISGFSMYSNFVSRSKVAYLQRRTAAAAATVSTAASKVDEAALPTINLLQADVLSALASRPPLAQAYSPVLDIVDQLMEQLQGPGSEQEQHSSQQKNISQAVVTAVETWQKPHLERCTVERGLVS